MAIFYHGTSVLFDHFDMFHLFEGDGKCKFGIGEYATSVYSTAALYAGKTKDETIVGLLHDVVEDSDWTLADLYLQRFSKEVLDAIGLLTHNKEYEPYEEYIDRIIKSGNHLAIAVKMNDLRHNIARGKAGNHERLVQKHEAALDKFNKPMFQ